MRSAGRIVFALLVAATPLAAQTGTVAGAAAVLYAPLGSLQDRFGPAVGGMIFAGRTAGPVWTWTGRFEFVDLKDLQEGSLVKSVKLQEGGGDQVYHVPLAGLTMRLKAATVSAVAQVELADWNPVRLEAHGGFGFTYWVYTRDAFRDSLFVTSTVTGQPTLAAVLAVPANRQTDWSGTLTLGLGARVRIADPLWLSAGAEYRLIVGELWPALDLDMENVSGMQFLCIRAGLMAEF